MARMAIRDNIRARRRFVHQLSVAALNGSLSVNFVSLDFPWDIVVDTDPAILGLRFSPVGMGGSMTPPRSIHAAPWLRTYASPRAPAGSGVVSTE